MRLKWLKGKNFLNMPVLLSMDVSVQLSVSCLFSFSKPLASLSHNRTAENDKYPNYCRKCTYQIYFPNNKLTNICRTYESSLCNRGPGSWEKWDPLCVSYCIAFLYCIVLSTGFTVKELYYVSILFNYISVFDSPKYWIFIILLYFIFMAETWMRQSLIRLRAKLSPSAWCSH